MKKKSAKARATLAMIFGLVFCLAVASGCSASTQQAASTETVSSGPVTETRTGSGAAVTAANAVRNAASTVSAEKLSTTVTAVAATATPSSSSANLKTAQASASPSASASTATAPDKANATTATAGAKTQTGTQASASPAAAATAANTVNTANSATSAQSATSGETASGNLNASAPAPATRNAGAETQSALYQMGDAGNYEIVKRGSTGAVVTALQETLTDLGYLRGSTGYFGTDTLSALESFQAKNNLDVDGIAGNSTWDVLLAGNAVAA